MKQRRLPAVCVAVAFLCSVGLSAQNDKKRDDAQKKEIQNIIKVVDDVSGGQTAANDMNLAWSHEDVLKAQGNKQYVPFTVTLDPSKVSGGTLAFYWRVINKSGAAAAAPAADAGKKDDKSKDKDKDKKKPEYAYEDISFVPVTAGQTSMRVSRSFTVAAGTYDVFIVVKEPTPDKAPKNAPPPKMSVLKQTVNVPDYWNGELNTSTVILAQRIDPLPAPLTPQQQADRPYALGTMEIVPVADTKFTKKSELSTFMLIYNPKVDANNKPDVVVEYSFCQVAAGTEHKEGEPCKAGEKFFNKTNPQALNAQTLPPQFDMAAGHQLQSGQAVSLAPFPEGQYRLEIKVTDKVSNKTLVRDVNFSVSAS
jgi:hypothetical protein